MLSSSAWMGLSSYSCSSLAVGGRMLLHVSKQSMERVEQSKLRFLQQQFVSHNIIKFFWLLHDISTLSGAGGCILVTGTCLILLSFHPATFLLILIIAKPMICGAYALGGTQWMLMCCIFHGRYRSNPHSGLTSCLYVVLIPGFIQRWFFFVWYYIQCTQKLFSCVNYCLWISIRVLNTWISGILLWVFRHFNLPCLYSADVESYPLIAYKNKILSATVLLMHSKAEQICWWTLPLSGYRK